MLGKSIIRVMKSKSTRWAEHVARVKYLKMHSKLWVQSVKGRDNLGDQ